jgi:hypothetical protein
MDVWGRRQFGPLKSEKEEENPLAVNGCYCLLFGILLIFAFGIVILTLALFLPKKCKSSSST